MADTDYPNTWGEGSLFATSGWDSTTSWEHPFVGQALDGRLGFRLSTDPPCELWFTLEHSGEDLAFEHIEHRIMASDIVECDFVRGGRVIATLTILAESPKRTLVECRSWAAVALVVHMRSEGSPEFAVEPEVAALLNGDTVALTIVPEGGAQFEPRVEATGVRCMNMPVDGVARMQIWRGDPATEPIEFDAVRDRCIGFIDSVSVPDRLDQRFARTYRKCATVMKVNTMSPEGRFVRRWSTPDRLPHRHQWLWDGAFHSVGMRHLDVNLAREFIFSVLDTQETDGFIPHWSRPDGRGSGITQPPILAWAAWDVSDDGDCLCFIVDTYERLCRHIEWIFRNRAGAGGLLYWTHGDESGMDNSPRFDHGVPIYAIDFNCYVVNELTVLSAMADRLNKSEDAARWMGMARDLAAMINVHMWDDEARIYIDLAMDSTPITSRCVSSFMALFAGVSTPSRAQSLLAQMQDPTHFAMPLPLPSVAASDPSYCDDMWRGPMWVNMNYMTLLGLRKYGYYREAQALAEQTMEAIALWYEKDGVIFEHYDAEGRRSPHMLSRKGRAGGGPMHTAIPDYHWTAALYIALAHL